jgi:uncharacterized Zn finger protein
MGRYENDYPPYVPVAERKKIAARAIKKFKKQGQSVQPVILASKVIANTFWGKAWCDNLQSYSDYENRLAKGRTYVRNGFVIDLAIDAGEINAIVCGSAIYTVNITTAKVVATKWQALVKECTGKINSLIELLQGKFSQSIMEIIIHPTKGLFPHPKEIKLNCSCPDYAGLCKHIAAVLYAVGARLDVKPEELFLLRKADHTQLIAQAEKTTIAKTKSTKTANSLANSDLSALFGIDIDNIKPKKLTKSKVKLTSKK